MSSEQTLVAGRYRLGAKIGSGAMGVVWQARDERLHRTVAVKQLLSQPGLSSEQAEEARQRAMREGRIAARLSHPNAITVYDVAEHDGQPWLIMEYLPSRSLATVLSDQNTIAPTEAARIGAQVASALVAAHAAGIVHRDIKPANVLLGEDGTVKITDFGISRATGDITVTATGMLAGTPAYLAPEVAKGETPAPSSDVFSLGSTLYTAVEGHSPFGLSENTLALLYAVAAGKITPPKQAGPLTALLMQLLRPNPNERPTMTAAREGLGAVAAGKPLPAATLGSQLTDPYPKPPGRPVAAPVPMPSSTPPPGTRLDIHPFSDPTPPPPRTPPGGQRPMGPMGPRTPGGGFRTAAPPPQQRKPDRDVRSIVLTVLAIVAAALVGVLVASLLTRDGDQRADENPAPLSSQNEQPASSTTTAAPTTTTTTPPPTTTPTTTETPKPTAEQYAKFIKDYYGLLPANVEAGWNLLTKNAQQLSKGYANYKDFYGKIKKVTVRGVKADDRGTVEATIRFDRKEGDDSNERYSFTVIQIEDGTFRIDSFRTLGDDEGDN